MLTNKRKLIACAAIALMTLCGLLAANWRSISIFASPAPDLFSMIPSDAPTVVSIDLVAIRESSLYKNRKDQSPITVPNSDYMSFVRATGFDFERDLDRVVIAIWPKLPTQSQPKAVMIAEGRFDLPKIRAYATMYGKITQQGKHEVFLFPPQAGSPASSTWNSMVFLDDHHVGIVGGTNVDALFSGAGITAADPIQERIARVQDAAAFVVVHASAFPIGAGMKGTAAGPFAGLAQTVDWLSLSIIGEGGDARISIEGECKTASDAQQLHSALELVRQLGLAGLSDPQAHQKMDPATFTALHNLVAGLDIKEVDTRVRILVELTPELLNVLKSQKTPGMATK